MKRFVCLLLVLGLLAGILPAEATVIKPYSAVDTYTMSDADLRALVADVGLEDTYREGMSYSTAMSAYLRHGCLTDFRENELADLRTRCAALILQLEEAGDEENLAKAKKLNTELQQQDAWLQYVIFELDNIIQLTSGAYGVVTKDDSLPEDVPVAWRDLQEARKLLDRLDGEIDEKNPYGYTVSASAVLKELNRLDSVAAGLSTGLQETVLAGGDEKSDFVITILRADQVGIHVYGEDKRPIAGAKVTMTVEGKTFTKMSSAEGVVAFSITGLKVDNHNRFWGELKVEKDGMRIYESHGIRYQGGERVDVRLEKDDGQPYVQFITFRGVDVLHETETIWCTDQNDAVQPFEVGVHTRPGSSSTFTMDYVNAKDKENTSLTRKVTGKADEVVTLKLDDQWCRLIAPDHEVSFHFTENTLTDDTANDQITIFGPINPIRGVVSKPIRKVPTDKSSPSLLGFTIDVPTPFSEPRNVIKFNVAVPEKFFEHLGINAYVSMDGDFVFSVASTLAREYGEGKDKDWKRESSKKRKEQYSDFLKGQVSMKQIAQEGIAKRGARTSALDLAKTKGTVTFSAVLSGKLKNPEKEEQDHNAPAATPAPAAVLSGKLENPEKNARNDDPPTPSPTPATYKGDLNLFLSVAGDITVSLCEYWLVGPVPVMVGADFSAGVMFGVDIPFAFKIPVPSDDTSLDAFALNLSKWQNVHFNSEAFKFILSPRVSISVFAGVGIKGLLAARIQGYAGFAAAFYFSDLTDIFVWRGSYTVSASLKLIVEFIGSSAKWTILEVEKTDHFPPKSTAGDAKNGSSGAGEDPDTNEVRYVTANVSDLKSMTCETGMKTVVSGQDVYSFYLEKDSATGVNKLKCLRTKNAAGATEVPLTNLGAAAYSNVKRTGNTVPENASVLNYDVVSVNDALGGRNGPELIAVYVLLSDEGTFKELAPKVYEEIYYLMPGSSPSYDSKSMGGVSYSGAMSLDEMKIDCATVTVSRDVNQLSDEYDSYLVTATRITDNHPFTVYFNTHGFRVYRNNTISMVATLLGPYNLPLQRTDENGRALYDQIIQIAAVCETATETGNRVTNIYSVCKLKAEEGQEAKTVFDVRSSLSVSRPTLITLDDDILSFRFIPATGRMNAMIALVSRDPETLQNRLLICDYKVEDGKTPVLSTPKELVKGISPVTFDFVNLGSCYALYYLQPETTSVMKDGSDPSGRYLIKAIYMGQGSDGNMIATKPFNIAVFDSARLDIMNGVNSFRMFSNRQGFLQGLTLQTGTDTAGSRTDTLKYFIFQQTLQTDIRNIIVENALVKPGEPVNLLFSLMNTGNLPISKVVLYAYAVRTDTGERRNLALIKINCVDPENSEVAIYETENGVTRELFTESGAAAVSQYAGMLVDDTDRFIVNTETGDTSVYATNVLMPEETHLYRARFLVPGDFSPAEYTIYVAPFQISTLVQKDADGRYDGTAAWLQTLTNLDGGTDSSAAKDLMTLTVVLPEDVTGSSSDGQLVPVSIYVEEESSGSTKAAAAPDRFSAFSSYTYADVNALNMNNADLSIVADRVRNAGDDYAHIVIRNETAAPMRNIVLTAALDGSTTFSYSFGDMSLEYMQTVTVDIPMSELTGGRTGETVTLEVTGDGNDINSDNNTDEITIGNAFMIIEDPTNKSVMEGENVTFSVAARGGVKPYTYQWQISSGGKNGPYHNISGENARKLKLTSVKLRDNGNWYRCIVTDASGESLTSRPAMLLVSKLPPPTGDSFDPLIPAMLVLSFALAVTLLLKRRKKA